MDNSIIKILKMKYTLLVICIFAVFVLLIISFIHLNSNSLGTGEQLYHLRMASEIANSKKIPSVDSQTIENRMYMMSPYHIVLALFILLFGDELSIIALPVILGIIMLIVFILTLKQMGIDRERITTIVFLVILSPTFLTIFSTLNEPSLILVLMFLAFYLLITFKSVILQILSFFIFTATLFFDLFTAVIAIAFFMLGYSMEKAKKGVIRLWIIFFIVVVLIYYKSGQFYMLFAYAKEPYLGVLLSDIGSSMGLSIFFLVLSLVGLGVFWKRKGELWLIYLIVLLVGIGFLLFKNPAMPYALFFLGIFAGFGSYRILVSQWKLKMLKDLTLLLILCGLFFSTLSYLNRIKASDMDGTLLDSLKWIQKNGKEGSVLSYQGYGFAIEYISNMPAVTDDFSSEKFINLSNYLFMLRNLDRIRQISEEYNIRYILITPEMKTGTVWSGKDEGILFLLRNNDIFRKVYEKNGVEVWEFPQG